MVIIMFLISMLLLLIGTVGFIFPRWFPKFFLSSRLFIFCFFFTIAAILLFIGIIYYPHSLSEPIHNMRIRG